MVEVTVQKGKPASSSKEEFAIDPTLNASLVLVPSMGGTYHLLSMVHLKECWARSSPSSIRIEELIL